MTCQMFNFSIRQEIWIFIAIFEYYMKIAFINRCHFWRHEICIQKNTNKPTLMRVFLKMVPLVWETLAKFKFLMANTTCIIYRFHFFQEIWISIPIFKFPLSTNKPIIIGWVVLKISSWILGRFGGISLSNPTTPAWTN